MFRRVFFLLSLLLLAGLLNGEPFTILKRVTITTDGLPLVNGRIFSSLLSADGRYVLISGGGVNISGRIFDTTSGTAFNFDGDPETFLDVSITLDGRYVYANHTTNPDYYRARLYDLQNNTFESIAKGKGLNGKSLNNEVMAGNLTPTGHYLVYTTDANNPFDGLKSLCDGSWRCSHIFLWNRVTNRQERIDVNNNSQPANYKSFGPQISDDGRYILFISEATNLDPSNPICYESTRNEPYRCMHFYVRDRIKGTVERVNYAPNDKLLKDKWVEWTYFGYALSGNGRYVAFTDFNALVGSRVLLRDVVTNTTEIVSVDSNSVPIPDTVVTGANSISYDGRYVLFRTKTEASDVILYLRDRKLGITSIVNQDGNGNIAGLSSDHSFSEASISRNGRYVAFSSASDQVEGTTPGDTSEKLFIASRPALIDHDLMGNGGFEEAVTPTNLNRWTEYNLTRDLQVCDVTTAHSGNCAFRFTATAGQNSRLIQMVQAPAGMPDETLTLSAWVKGQNLSGARIRATIYYFGAPKTVIDLDSATLNAGTYEYTQLTASTTLAGMVRKVAVEVRMANGTGRLWVDDVRLALTELDTFPTTSQPFIPLPLP